MDNITRFIYEYNDAIVLSPRNHFTSREDFKATLEAALEDADLDSRFYWSSFVFTYNLVFGGPPIEEDWFDDVDEAEDWDKSPNLRKVFEKLIDMANNPAEPFDVKTLL